jgi:hypothetical protein
MHYLFNKVSLKINKKQVVFDSSANMAPTKLFQVLMLAFGLNIYQDTTCSDLRAFLVFVVSSRQMLG